MILQTTNFKARLTNQPKIKDEKTQKGIEVGKFTIGKKYRVYSVFDSGQGFTDFLVADDRGIFRWINISVFRE